MPTADEQTKGGFVSDLAKQSGGQIALTNSADRIETTRRRPGQVAHCLHFPQVILRSYA